ncbi:hypothetical protein HMPREF9513_00777 [Enterococcus faecalis TX0645]|nr:hypothetical protein HMPREF9513_00777 [Enterococcus faecalis TX0645]
MLPLWRRYGGWNEFPQIQQEVKRGVVTRLSYIVQGSNPCQ